MGRRIAPLALAVTLAAGAGIYPVMNAAAATGDDDPASAADMPPPATATVIVAGSNGQEAVEVPIGESEALVAPTEPPDPLYEEPSDLPGPGFRWIHGYWGWTGADWTWYPAEWLVPPSGLFYVDPYYERVGGNVVFVPGYWAPRDAPIRYYGGERIRFREAIRPADYRRGERVIDRHSGGSPPGARGAGSYQRSAGSGRAVALPTATAPRSTSSLSRGAGSPRGEGGGARSGGTAGGPGSSARGAPEGGHASGGQQGANAAPQRGPGPAVGGGRPPATGAANVHAQPPPHVAAAPHTQAPPPRSPPAQQHEQAKRK